MKTIKLLAIGACAAFALTTITTSTVLAAEKKEHAEKAEKIAVPDTAEGIMAEIHKHHGELADVVKSKLADVHHHAFAIRDLANGLPAKVAADKKGARVEGSVKNIAKLAEDLDKTGDDNNQAMTEANLKKLDGVLMALDKQVK